MNKSTISKGSLKGIAALLVHVASIDENYTDHEKKIIKEFIASFSYKEAETEEILNQAEKLESDSIQLLSFTNLIKKETLEIKIEIIEHLWRIIISDQSIDQYESSLMRRICGLIYFPDKLSGEIKLKILNIK